MSHKFSPGQDKNVVIQWIDKLGTSSYYSYQEEVPPAAKEVPPAAIPSVGLGRVTGSLLVRVLVQARMQPHSQRIG